MNEKLFQNILEGVMNLVFKLNCSIFCDVQIDRQRDHTANRARLDADMKDRTGRLAHRNFVGRSIETCRLFGLKGDERKERFEKVVKSEHFDLL